MRQHGDTVPPLWQRWELQPPVAPEGGAAMAGDAVSNSTAAIRNTASITGFVFTLNLQCI